VLVGSSMARTITFQPSSKMNEFIETLVSSGDYGNQSEAIRAAVRLLQEKQAKSKLTQIRRLIHDGDESLDVENFSMLSIKQKLDAN
jgi:antitoxin ParD1/3/4